METILPVVVGAAALFLIGAFLYWIRGFLALVFMISLSAFLIAGFIKLVAFFYGVL